MQWKLIYVIVRYDSAGIEREYIRKTARGAAALKNRLAAEYGSDNVASWTKRVEIWNY